MKLTCRQAPLHLLNVQPGQAVDVKVASRTNETFSPPKQAKSAFSGKGQRLGDLAGPTTSVSKPEPAASVPKNGPDVDPSKPTTSLQLRLTDGSRVNATFNTTHTVAQLYDYVQSRSNRSFTLLSGRPPTVLSADDGRTLEEAQLLNTVVIQQ
ncbi:hypothetical protein PSACC_00523 [Paramicrosporidium saccamoebae]|uniref:UBX domain-containing protein n=1 Tax=Paramicrosporidium saccamoebae TaxID=1246581 RepID=A0A2H9TPI3_9FUNG|nr:hypothetical protein PSACC_00523 [Paramicrosporidium saccamoebae]